MIVFALVAAFVASKTPFGRHVYAIGGNERAAELSGVRIARTKIIVYMISGFCSAMVGLIIASQLVAAHPATGTFFELNAIAAVVLGGTSLAGGRGGIGGTIIGAFVIGVLVMA
jgi:erythritol transport system permease protein